MSQLRQCPDCGKTLRIPDVHTGVFVKCPKCGGKFRATEQSAGETLRRDGVSGERRRREESSDDDEFAPEFMRSPGPRRKKRTASAKLQPFLQRWLIACGVVLAIAALFGVGGLFSEAFAIIASMICVIAVLGCVLAGTIWMVIDLGRDSALLALCAAVAPPVGLVVSFQKKSPAMRGAVVFVSMLGPTLLLGLMLLVFYPKYAGAGRQAVQTAKWEDLMHQLDNQVRPESPVVTVTVSVAARPGSLDSIEPRCESLLSPFKSYVQRSFKVDPVARTITYQYRGSENFKTMIAFYLSSSTGAFIPQMPVDAESTNANSRQ